MSRYYASERLEASHINIICQSLISLLLERFQLEPLNIAMLSSMQSFINADLDWRKANREINEDITIRVAMVDYNVMLTPYKNGEQIYA